MRQIRQSLMAGALVIVGTAVCSNMAAAGPTYDATKTYGNSVFGTPNWRQNATLNYNGSNMNVAAGVFRISFDDGEGDEFDLATFCVELDQHLVLPSEYGLAEFDQSEGELINALWSNAYGLISDSQTAAAFQFALWEITHDQGFDLGSGTLSIDGNNATEQLAQTWLNDIQSGAWTADSTLSITKLASDDSQDLVWARRTSVPEPATALLLLGGGALVVFAHSCRRSTARTDAA